MHESKQSGLTGFGLLMWTGGVLVFALGMYSKQPLLLMNGLIGAAMSAPLLSWGRHIESGRSTWSFWLTFTGLVQAVCAVAVIWMFALLGAH